MRGERKALRSDSDAVPRAEEMEFQCKGRKEYGQRTINTGHIFVGI